MVRNGGGMAMLRFDGFMGRVLVASWCGLVVPWNVVELPSVYDRGARYKILKTVYVPIMDNDSFARRFDDEFARLACIDNLFRPRDGHHLIDIKRAKSTGLVTFFDKFANESRISEWVSDETSLSDDIDCGLRLLICSPRTTPHRIENLPISRSTWNSVAQSWSFPTMFVRAIEQSLPVSMFFGNDRKDKGLILRTNQSFVWDYGLALTYDTDNRITRAICIGLLADEVKQVTDCLAKLQNFHGCPTLFPALLLNYCCIALSEIISQCRRETWLIQKSTGLADFYMLKERKDLPQNAYNIDRTSLDLDFLTGQLISLTDTIGALGDRCITLQRFETTITSFTSRTSKILGPFIASGHLEDLLWFNRESVISAQMVLKYLESAVHAQVQQVYSLIGQKDNRLNMEAADAARRLSADSRRIAFVAGKDSANMRIIAAMTLVFLPGTFTATLLSSSFFSFKNGTQGIVSEWIWLYWVITCILTIVVVGAWFLVSRKEIEKMKRVIEIEEGKAEASEMEKRTRESAHAIGLSKQLEDVGLAYKWRRANVKSM